MGSSPTKIKVFFAILKGVLQLLLNIIFYALVVLIILELSTAGYKFSYQIFGDVAVEEAPGQDIIVQIQEGESTRSIARKLELKKLVVNQYSFYLRAKMTTGDKKPILPGTYTLNTSMNYDAILATITDIEAGKINDDDVSTE